MGTAVILYAIFYLPRSFQGLRTLSALFSDHNDLRDLSLRYAKSLRKRKKVCPIVGRHFLLLNYNTPYGVTMILVETFFCDFADTKSFFPAVVL